MNHSMTSPSLLRKAMDAFDRGAFATSAKYTLEIGGRQPQGLEEAHIALATRLARLECLTAAQFNKINRLYARSDIDWFNRLFCAHRSGDVAAATAIRARHTGSPYRHLIDFLNAALSGSFITAAEHEHLFKFANDPPSFPYRRFIRLEQGKHLSNGVLALVDGLGEILMALNILKHDRELASSMHTVATPERYHPVVRLLLPRVNLITPDRLAPHSELTYSSDLIFRHFQSGRVLQPIQRLPQNPGRKLVGIAWRGGAGEVGKSGEGPRAASLESLLALLPAGDFTYVSLQYN